MGLILLTCSLFLLVSGLHFIVCLSIDTPLYWFGLNLLFTTAFSVYAGFWPTVTCIRRFLAKSRVHTQLFFIQSRTSSLLVSLMLWEVAGWVVSVVGSSLGLKLSVGCFFCDQRSFMPISGITSTLAYRLGSPPFAWTYDHVTLALGTNPLYYVTEPSCCCRSGMIWVVEPHLTWVP